jgi:DNA-directed RNA polymerase specialized sigma24 family protein
MPEPDPDDGGASDDHRDIDAMEEGSSLTGSAEIVHRLQAAGAGPDSADWLELAGILIDYGYPILKGWLIAGLVKELAARHRLLSLSRIPDHLALCEEEAHDLSMDTLFTALPRYHRLLINGTWTPDGRANVKTYFVRCCLATFPDAYEKWNRSRQREASTERVDLIDLADARPLRSSIPNPENVTVARTSVDEILQDPETRLMFDLQQQGYSLVEIAEQLDTPEHRCTEPIVRTRMTRARNRARTMDQDNTDTHASPREYPVAKEDR